MVKAAQALVRLCGDLNKKKNLLRPFLLMWLKLILNPLLPVEPGQTWTGLTFHSESLMFEPSIPHFERLLLLCESLPLAILFGLVLKLATAFVVKLLTKSSQASSSGFFQ